MTSFESERFPHITELLLRSNSRAEDITSMLEANAPAPVWLNELLGDARHLVGFRYVISEMRRNPDKLIDFSSNLQVAHWYSRRGVAAEFLQAGSSATPDLLLNSDTHAEVKTLVDTSLWSRLIRDIRNIPSNYGVVIGADYELTNPQITQIISDVRNTIDSLTESTEQRSFPAAEFTFIRIPGQGTRVISIGPRTLDESTPLGGPIRATDLSGTGEYAMRMKAAAISRLRKASEQLAGHSKTMAVLDLQRHFSSDEDFLDEIFLGSLQGDWASRASDGIVAAWENFPSVQNIVVFVNLGVRRVFSKPGTQADSWLG